jgi:hypothetical protein
MICIPSGNGKGSWAEFTDRRHKKKKKKKKKKTGKKLNDNSGHPEPQHTRGVPRDGLKHVIRLVKGRRAGQIRRGLHHRAGHRNRVLCPKPSPRLAHGVTRPKKKNWREKKI